MQELRLDNVLHWLPFLNEPVISLWNIRWCEPIAIATIKSLKLANPKLKIIKPLCKDLNCYLDVIESEQNSEDKTYMPLKTINVYSRSEVDKTSNEIVNKILNNTFIDHKNQDNRYIRDYIDFLSYMINEVLLNAVYHSESSIEIVAFAQHYKTLRKTQVAIVDCGIGFRATISRRYVVKDDANALELAIQKGVTGAREYSYQSSIRNVGIGLYALRRMIEKLNGNLVMISYNGFLRISSNNLFCKNYTHKLWNGSVVAFEFNTDEINVNFLEFMKNNVYIEDEGKEEDIF